MRRNAGRPGSPAAHFDRLVQGQPLQNLPRSYRAESRKSPTSLLTGSLHHLRCRMHGLFFASIYYLIRLRHHNFGLMQSCIVYAPLCLQSLHRLSSSLTLAKEESPNSTESSDMAMTKIKPIPEYSSTVCATSLRHTFADSGPLKKWTELASSLSERQPQFSFVLQPACTL